MSLISFGERIRSLRKVQGLSQEELAGIAGINRSYIAGIENGKRNVSLENIEKLAKAFGLTLSEFFNYDTIIPQQIIYLNIEGEQFALKADKSLTYNQRIYIDSLCRTVFECDEDDEDNEEYQQLVEMSSFDLANWFVANIKKELGITLKYVPIELECKIIK